MKTYLIVLFFITNAASAANAISNKYTIDSDQQLILPNGNIRAIGHVHIVSGDMVIDAEEAIYHREIPDKTYIVATGNPVRYKGVTENNKPFSGNSKNLKYYPDTAMVIMTDEAFIQQKGISLSADVMTYNTITRKMTASAVSKKVRSIISPEITSKKKNSSS